MLPSNRELTRRESLQEFETTVGGVREAMGRRNYSLYAIYGTADHSLYIGHSCWLRARLGRHAAELEKGEHHAPLLEQAYRRSLAAGKPLQVIGLDWDTDETLVKV